MMDRSSFEKFGTVGAVVAAAACPICFPKLALVGAAVGFGVFAPYEGYVAVGIQVLFVLAFVGQVLAFPRHRNRLLLALSAVATALLFAGYYLFPSSTLLQVSLAGLVAASVWLVVESRRCITCEAQAPGARADA
jgi:mercuric ion transport protein